MKNPTPKFIAFIASGLLAFVVLSSHLLFKISFINGLALSLITFIVSYLVILYALEFFIYRKIKVIYKSIYDVKGNKFNELVNEDMRSGDPISEVDQEVLKWAKGYQDEIDKLKFVEEYRKEFLGNVAHELKTPIFNLQGYIHTLLDGALEDEKLAKHFLVKASKSADRMEMLVKDLLTISEIESGQIKLDYEDFDIIDLIQDIYDSLELKALERNMTLRFKAGITPPFIVNADKKRIRQVFVNLIVNAIKYGKENGIINVGVYDMHDNYLVEVADNGEGIAKEHLNRLFERFYRVDKARSRNEGGTGLGLSIVKHIVEAHNQTVNVRSTLGEGTTFGVTLKKSK